MAIHKELYFIPTLFLRSPAYPTGNYRPASIDQLLNDPYFLASIKVSSAAVYEELKKADFDGRQLSYRMKCTLRRYFNRMCFRPTPFGINSTVCAITWGDGAGLQLADRTDIVIQPDFDTLLKAYSGLHNSQFQQAYVATGSLYRCGGEFRYIRYKEDEKHKRSFELEAVQASPYLDSILQYCSERRSAKKIIRLLADQYGGTADEAQAYLQELVSRQLLLPELQPHVTGDFTSSLNSVIRDIVPTAIRQTLSASDTNANAEDQLNEAAYINSERKATGVLPFSYQQKLYDGIEALTALLPSKPSDDLDKFKERFKKKFDQQAVPLLLALDPELGVGYANIGNDLIKPAYSLPDSKVAPQAASSYDELHAMLLDKWHQLQPGQGIQLQPDDLAKLPKRKAVPYPPTTSVLFRIADDQVFVDQAGGVTGTSLPGRFSTISEDLYEHALGIAQWEEAQNPDVIFAEVAHFSDSHIANIERRKSLYQFEIPICTGSVLPSERQIPLSDLLISVHHDTIILTSQRLQKRVTPRHSSAYNFGRSNLAVFRFLCELPYDGLNTLGQFHLARLFPGLGYYPRVTYRDTVIQLATWKLKTQDYVHLRHTDDFHAKVAAMRQMAKRYGLPRFISVDDHDNQLIFDTENADCLELLSFSFKPGLITLKEFPFVTENSAVRDAAGNNYINQFVGCLYRKGAAYQPVVPGPSANMPRFLPMDDWLYYKIYCHPARANWILTALVKPLINDLQKHQTIRRWFFIRYNDPDYHIRLRMQPEEGIMAAVQQRLNAALQGCFDQGLIAGIQIAGYEREWERYPAEAIEEIELSFQKSAELTLHHLSDAITNEGQPEHYDYLFQSIKLLLSAFPISADKLLSMFRTLYLSFEREFSVSHDSLNARLRELRANVSYQLQRPESDFLKDDHWQAFGKAHKVVALKCGQWPVQRQARLVADLVHMHINRFLVKDARRQEMLIYYCIYKSMQADQARSKKSRNEVPVSN